MCDSIKKLSSDDPGGWRYTHMTDPNNNIGKFYFCLVRFIRYERASKTKP